MEHPTKVFDEWAISGKDKGMEISHADSVSEILDYALSRLKTIDNKFTFLDIGCGNGWVVDKLSRKENCTLAMGIDGADNMIINANKRESKGTFLLKDINDFKIETKFDLIFSMEVLYYLEDPSEVIKKTYELLNPNGRFIIGIDHYFENEDCHNWQEKVGTLMHLFNEQKWKDFFKDASFSNIFSWRANSNDWAGTLVITGTR
ncbi:MAG: class I SAM-dependent methyltransferase [Candidatus Poseidoniia archaeon]|nr:class I SAM-dependent methyltransferase [Candidatus Poseidoniia archaeon]